MGWNPTSGLTGLEWPVVKQTGTLLSTENAGAAAEFDSSATETIDTVAVYLDRVTGAPQLRLDIFDVSNLPETVQTDTFRPNEDVAINAVRDDGGGSTNLWAAIDETTLDTSDYLTSSGGTNTYTFRVASTGGLTPTSPRVGKVRVKVVVENTTSSEDYAFNVKLDIGAATYTSDNLPSGSSTSKSDGVTTITFEWADNPDTGDAWTESDIQTFDSTWEVRFEVGDTSTTWRLYQAWMEVDSTETPAATGTLTPTADGWATCTLDSSWSKSTSTTYAVVLVKTNSDGQVVWTALDSEAACPHVSWVSYRPTVSATSVLTALGDSRTPAHPVVMNVSGGSSSADSQPYATLDREAVYTGRTVEQEITPSTSPTVGWATIVAAKQAATADASLTVKVKRRSDDAQQGGTWTVADSDVTDDPRRLRQLDGNLASTGSLSASTQYYIEMASTATSGAGWEVAVLNSQSAPDSADADGFGGTTDAATVDTTEDTSTDAPAAVGTVPTSVSGFTATASV